MPNYFQRDWVFTDLVLYLVNKNIFQTSTSWFVLIFSFRAAILLCPNTICVWQVSSITKYRVCRFLTAQATVAKHTFVLRLIYDKFQVFILVLRENHLSYIYKETNLTKMYTILLLFTLNMHLISFFISIK